jgi:hypothetical protein
LHDLAIAAAVDQPSIAGAKNYPKAFQLLSIEAQRAAWRATGIPTDGDRRREISPFEWHDFRIFEGLHCDGVRTRRSTGYDDCRFPVAGLVNESFRASGVNDSPPARRGRKPMVPWGSVKKEFLKLMNHHGDISCDDPEWNSKEKAIAALQHKHDVSRSALQPKVDAWLKEWRRSRTATK